MAATGNEAVTLEQLKTALQGSGSGGANIVVGSGVFTSSIEMVQFPKAAKVFGVMTEGSENYHDFNLNGICPYPSTFANEDYSRFAITGFMDASSGILPAATFIQFVVGPGSYNFASISQPAYVFNGSSSEMVYAEKYWYFYIE